MGSNGIVIDAGGGQTITVNVSGINFQTGPNGSVLNIPSDNPVELGGGVWDDPSVRSSLGFSTNLNTFWKSTNSSDARSAVNLGATWLTNTNVTNFRTAIGLGSSDSVQFDEVFSQSFEATAGGTNYIRFNSESISFGTPSLAAATRTNLALGATNDVVFNSISFSGGGTSRLTNDSFYFGTNLIFSIEDASFSVPVAFAGSNTAATTRTNLGLGWSALTNANAANFRTEIGLGTTNIPQFNGINLGGSTIEPDGSLGFNFKSAGTTRVSINYGSGRLSLDGGGFALGFGAANTNGAGLTRTNVGLPLAALTNTSNVTAMRALSGSTNTNHPFSGSVSVVGTNNTNTLVFSNGILQEVQ
jgi:hypothetical protein